MTGQSVAQGAVYYRGLRRRREIVFDLTLRSATLDVIHAVRVMLSEQRLPEALNDRRCRRCSLATACLPQVAGEPSRLRGLQGALYTAYAPGEEPEDAQV